MQVSTGSTDNLKPELVMEAFFAWMGLEICPYALLINRDEVYAEHGRSLEELGEEILGA